MAVQIDSDHTGRVGFSIRVKDWNMDVVVGCSVCTSSEYAGKGTPG